MRHDIPRGGYRRILPAKDLRGGIFYRNSMGFVKVRFRIINHGNERFTNVDGVVDTGARAKRG